MSTRRDNAEWTSRGYPPPNGYRVPGRGPIDGHDPGTVIEFGRPAAERTAGTVPTGVGDGSNTPGPSTPGRSTADLITAGRISVGRLTAGWSAARRPLVRGAGMGCAFVGFGLLVASQVLPWQSSDAPAFTITGGGRTETGVAQLPLATEMLSLGWLLILAAVASALAVGGPARRIITTVGAGLVTGQIALLAGVAYGIRHTTITTTYRGAYFSRTTPVVMEAGVYAAFAAAAVLGLALLLAHGLPRRIRDAETEVAAPEPGPADLTVTAEPDPDPNPQPDAWRRGGDIDVSGRYLDR